MEYWDSTFQHETAVLFKFIQNQQRLPAVLILLLFYFLFDTASAVDTSSQSELRNKRMTTANFHKVGIQLMQTREYGIYEIYQIRVFVPCTCLLYDQFYPLLGHERSEQ